MLEKAKIIKIDGARVTVSCFASAGCSTCSGKMCGGKNREFDAWNTNGLDLRTGSIVEVNIPSGSAVLTAFLLLVMPLLMFLSAYAGTAFFFPESTEGLKVLSGTGALFLGLLAGSVLAGIISKKTRPRVEALLEN
jgi:positive regulator of sigma E activity